MSGYEVNFTAMKAAADHLSEILSDLSKQIDRMGEIESAMMNESVWKGPKRSEYVKNFDAYRAALTSLYNNGRDHLVTLQEEMTTYARPENS